MAKLAHFKVHAESAAAELLYRGFSRRTTATEPRLSELVDEYRRIGYEVEVVEYRVDPNACNVCFEEGAKAGERYGDIYVRTKAAQESDR